MSADPGPSNIHFHNGGAAQRGSKRSCPRPGEAGGGFLRVDIMLHINRDDGRTYAHRQSPEGTPHTIMVIFSVVPIFGG